jgi:hypothetical protein
MSDLWIFGVAIRSYVLDHLMRGFHLKGRNGADAARLSAPKAER